MADSLKLQVKQLVEANILYALRHHFQEEPIDFEWVDGDIISLITGNEVTLRVVLSECIVRTSVKEVEDGALEVVYTQRPIPRMD
jgi:hypothetical protein